MTNTQWQFPRLKDHPRGIPKLDRLSWAEDIAIIAYGVCIGLRANRPGLIEQYLSILPPSWKFAKSPFVDRLYSITGGRKDRKIDLPQSHLVYANGERIARAPLPHSADALENDLQIYVAEMSPRRVFVHAG